jgi:hypothetical protein
MFTCIEAGLFVGRRVRRAVRIGQVSEEPVLGAARQSNDFGLGKLPRWDYKDFFYIFLQNFAKINGQSKKLQNYTSSAVGHGGRNRVVL